VVVSVASFACSLVSVFICASHQFMLGRSGGRTCRSGKLLAQRLVVLDPARVFLFAADPRGFRRAPARRVVRGQATPPPPQPGAGGGRMSPAPRQINPFAKRGAKKPDSVWICEPPGSDCRVEPNKRAHANWPRRAPATGRITPRFLPAPHTADCAPRVEYRCDRNL